MLCIGQKCSHNLSCHPLLVLCAAKSQFFASALTWSSCTTLHSLHHELHCTQICWTYDFTVHHCLARVWTSGRAKNCTNRIYGPNLKFLLLVFWALPMSLRVFPCLLFRVFLCMSLQCNNVPILYPGWLCLIWPWQSLGRNWRPLPLGRPSSPLP